jgi:hypothetical protein
MSDVFDHNPSEPDDPAAAATWVVSLVGVLLLVATILGVTAIYYNVKATEVEEAVLALPYKTVETMRSRQEALLQGPPRRVTRVDETGEVEVLVIPIDRAMELVVAEHQR